METEKLLIGAHTSAAGGPHNALLEGQSIGATTIQLFTSNQKRWEGKPISREMQDLWFKTKEETGIDKIMSHDSYLINLGSPNEEMLQKSRTAFREEIKRCQSLKLSFLNFHPGAALKESVQQCLDLIAESLIQTEDLFAKNDSSLMLLLECTAGQGSCVGRFFEELGYIIEKVKGHVPIGVCIDTCHIFAAGYDIRTEAALDATLRKFDDEVGLYYLKAFHLNDSQKGLGSRVDRHRPLGEGEIGMEAFRLLMTDKRTRHLPKYLETPDGPPLWKKEIQLLRNFAHD